MPRLYALAALLLCGVALAEPVHHQKVPAHASTAEAEYEALIATTTLPTAAQVEENKHCPYTRQQCIECAARHADTNRDGRIDLLEVAAFESRILNWWQRALAWFVPPREIMRRCADAEGFITRQSLEDKKFLCLKNCIDWQRFMPLCEKLDRTE